MSYEKKCIYLFDTEKSEDFKNYGFAKKNILKSVKTPLKLANAVPELPHLNSDKKISPKKVWIIVHQVPKFDPRVRIFGGDMVLLKFF